MPPVHSVFRRPGGLAVTAAGAAVAAALLVSPGAAAASADRPSVAVFAPTVAPTVKWRAHVYPVRLQDAVIRGLRATGSPGVMTRSELVASLKAADLVLAPGPAEAAEVGARLGVDYVMLSSVTSYGPRRARLVRGVVRTSLIDTSTGEIVWADEVAASARTSYTTPPGAGASRRLFDRIAARQAAFTGSDEELGALIAWIMA